MNHNGVISLPLKSGFDQDAGVLIQVENASGVAVAAVNAAANGAKSIGVLMHDADQSSSDLPAAIQLFSAGGSAVVKVSDKVASAGAAIYAAGAGAATTTAGSNKMIGYSLEAPNVANNIAVSYTHLTLPTIYSV